MKRTKKYFPSTMFSGETILSGNGYDTYEEAKRNTNPVYPDVDWEEYNEYGIVVGTSYGCAAPWI